MKVAIIGASGQLGGRTLASVVERGFAAEDIVAGVRSPDKLAEWKERGVDVRHADYDDITSLRTAFEGVERVLLVPSMAFPAERVQQYDNAINAARDAGVRHLLHYGLVPTILESPFPITPFLLYVESALRVSGLAWTVLRNGLYAEPIVEWVPDIIEMGTIPYPTGDARCAYVSRDDIGRAGAAALTTDGHEGKVYNLTGPEALSTAELCSAVAKATGKDIQDRRATDEDYVKAGLASGDSEALVHALLSLYHTIRDGHLDLVSDDVEKLTGRPATSFADLLSRHHH